MVVRAPPGMVILSRVPSIGIDFNQRNGTRTLRLEVEHANRCGSGDVSRILRIYTTNKINNRPAP